MAQGQSRIGVEPEMWFIVFETKAPARWLRWLAMGRFKHAFAIGWLPDIRCWLIYDVSLGRTRVAVMPDCPDASEKIAALRADAVTVAMPAGPERRPLARVGFWCVPAVAHLVGVKGQPFRPDALYRACLAQGGEIVDW